MMGFDIYEAAMKLLGYVMPDGSLADDASFRDRGLNAINQILIDIGVQNPLATLCDELMLSTAQRECCVYGTCMLLSIGESDRVKNELFTKIYNSKRAYCKGSKVLVEEKILREEAI